MWRGLTQAADRFVLTECSRIACAISCPRTIMSWSTSVTDSSIPVNMNTFPFYTNKNSPYLSHMLRPNTGWRKKLMSSVLVVLTGRTKALTSGLSTTWTLQGTSDTSRTSLFLCTRSWTDCSTTWCRGWVTGRRSSANSSMYWRTETVTKTTQILEICTNLRSTATKTKCLF